MSQEAEFAASSESRIKDLEQALAATKHLLEKAREERDEALDCGATGGEEACGGCIACLRADAARLERERDALQADLRRATEERNQARESLRAQAFELQLLRDEPAERRLAAVTAERDELQRAVDIAAEGHAAQEADRAELARRLARESQRRVWAVRNASRKRRRAISAERRLAALDATAAAQLHEACDLIEAGPGGAGKVAKRNERLADALTDCDAAGRSLPDLLRAAWQLLRDLGRDGPLEDCLRLKADDLDAALAEVTP